MAEQQGPLATIHDAVLQQNYANIRRLIEENPALLNAPTPQYLETPPTSRQGQAIRTSSICPGSTPISIACILGDKEMVHLLLSSGADLHQRNQDEWEPFLIATSKGHLSILSLLLEYGADINKKWRHGWSSLMVASYHRQTEVIEFLLNHQHQRDTKIPLDDQSSLGGYSALYLACLRGEAPIVKLLLQAGANPLLESNGVGGSPMNISRLANHHECAALLQTALVEPQRAHLLQKVKVINDATHAGTTANTTSLPEQQGARLGSTTTAKKSTRRMIREERKRQCIAAAPACLKGRVEREEPFPVVQVNQRRRRRLGAKRWGERKGGGVARGITSTAITARMMLRNSGRSNVEEGSNRSSGSDGDIRLPEEKSWEKEEERQAVLEYVIGGKLPIDLFVELMELMLPKWA